MAIAKTAIKYFKYVNTVRRKDGKLRTWPGHNKQHKAQQKKDYNAYWRSR